MSNTLPDCPPPACNSVHNNQATRIDQETLTANTDIPQAPAAEKQSETLDEVSDIFSCSL